LIHKKILMLLAATFVAMILCSQTVSATTVVQYMTAINGAAGRLIALQSASDYGWDWDVTGLTSHSANPSATNIYGVTALGLIYAYQKTGDSTYLTAAKKTADFIKYGDPTLGDFWNGIPPAYTYYWGYSFDYKFLAEFSKVYGDPSYKTYASNAWSWQKANIMYYADGSQAVAYSHFVANGGGSDGYGGWQSSDYGLATIEVGDTPWALSMASVINSNIGNIASSGTYKDLGMAWALKLLVTVDPTRATYGSGITTLISNLEGDQLANGSWHDGNPEGDAQTTAYAVMGLLTAGEYNAALKGADWLLGSQINGGWLASSTEYSETDSEAMQALTASVVQFTVANSPADHDSPSPAVGTTSYFVGDTVIASVTTPADDNGLGTRYTCTGYTGTGDLAAGGSGSSVSFTITQPTSITWDWIPQYYLTVDAGGHGTAGGEDWYTANVNAQATITPLTVGGTTGTQYVFAGWSGDATGSGSPSDNILMNGPKTATATWTTQYWVTYAANVPVTLPASEWVVSGNAATGVFPSPVISGGTQYVYLSDDRPSTITAPTTITATYKTQYLITFSQTGVGSDFIGTILTVDANAYHYSDLAGPLNLWLDAGNHGFQFFSPLAVGTGKQYAWTGTSGGLTTLQGDPLIVSGSGSVVGTYKTQYYVTFDQTGVDSDFAGTVVTVDSSNYGVSGLPVSFWWDEGSGHSFSFASPLAVDAIKQYVWSSTSGLSTLQNDPLTVTSSGSVVGNYILQNAITFDQFGISSDFTGTVVTIDGTSYGVGALPVSFYWTTGSTHSFVFQSPLVVTANAKQYLWTSTTGLSSVQSDPITVTTYGNIVGNYKTQYYLTVQTGPSGVNSPTGEGWYDAGSSASISTAQYEDIVPGSSRYRFNGWTTTDMLEITNPSLTSTTVLMDNAKTVTADYVTQYYITFAQSGVGSDFAGTVMTIDGTYHDGNGAAFWWDVNSVHTFMFASPLAVNGGKQYVWTSTTGLSTLQSDPLTVTGSGSVTGNYKTQYYVTFDQSGVGSDFTGTVATIDSSNYGVSGLPVSFWWDEGSSHTFSFVSLLAVDGIKQYVWSSTSGLSTLQNDPLTVTASGSVVGNYVLQNAITFDQLGIGSDFTGTVVTVDGTSYGVGALPVSFYWTMGSTHTFAFQSPLTVGANTKQYVWTVTTGLSSVQSDPVTVTTYGNIVGNYNTQYYLTLATSPSGVNAPSSPGWYDAGTYASISTAQYEDIVSGSSRYRFNGWTTTDMLEITNPSATATTVYMDKVKTVTANYVIQYYLTVGTSPSGVNSPTGQGWYDAGSLAPISTPQDVDIVSGSSRYDFRGWQTTDMSEITASSAASTTVLMDKAKTVTADYVTQYYVTFAQSGVGSDFSGNVMNVGGTDYDRNGHSDWYDSGASISFSFYTPLTVTANVKQYVFLSSSTSSPLSVSGLVTVTGSYKTQYYVTFVQSGVGSDFSGTVVTIDGTGHDRSGASLWWDDGSVHTFTYASPLVVTANVKRYFLTGFDASSPYTVSGSATITGSYKTQYNVTFAQSGVGSDFTGTVVTIDSSNYAVNALPVSFWWDEGSGHSFSFASPLAVNVIKQYVWSSTSGLSTLQNDPLTITTSGSVVGNYIPTNAITFDQLGVGSDFTGTVVTIDSTPYGVSSLPVSFYWTMGSTHSFVFQSPLVTANAKQYLWTSTTGLSSLQSDSITVTTYGTIVGHYKTQYHLTVSSYSGLVPAPTPASGWFDAGSQVTLTAPQTGHDPQGTLYAFHGVWTVNGRDIQGNTVQITMNSSTVAIAWYVDPPAFGDVNDDGRVDLTDLVLIARHYGTVLGYPGYNYLYDLNGDGRIDLIDLAAVARAIQP
jgi:uncharacterized repeat protein (TIGR02543 family)